MRAKGWATRPDSWWSKTYQNAGIQNSADDEATANDAPPSSDDLQQTCGFLCKLGNWLDGNGFKTDAEITEERRQWLLDHAANETDKDKIRKASAEKVNSTYQCLQSSSCRAEYRTYVESLARAAAAATITFGHGARHLQGTGLSQSDVETAIKEDVRKSIGSGSSQTGNFWGRVTVQGTTIEYRAYTLSNGTINIGTYYVP